VLDLDSRAMEEIFKDEYGVAITYEGRKTYIEGERDGLLKVADCFDSKTGWGSDLPASDQWSAKCAIKRINKAVGA
jgi:hypothetical protein